MQHLGWYMTNDEVIRHFRRLHQDGELTPDDITHMVNRLGDIMDTVYQAEQMLNEGLPTPGDSDHAGQ